jgi:hypothetical protein
MGLHLIKLCVGADNVDDLARWQKSRFRKRAPEHWTRMMPKRKDELLDGGSLYWVIKGRVEVRQKLLDLIPFTDEEGVGRVRLVLDRALVPVVPRPYRAFQGWRYLSAKDAPKDLAKGADPNLPGALKETLAELGLL